MLTLADMQKQVAGQQTKIAKHNPKLMPKNRCQDDSKTRKRTNQMPTRTSGCMQSKKSKNVS